MVTYLPSKHFELQYLGHTANKVTPHHLSHKRDQDFTNILHTILNTVESFGSKAKVASTQKGGTDNHALGKCFLVK